jgi:hypothetical protein
MIRAASASVAEPLADYRSRRALELHRASEQRELDLAEQCSLHNTPEMRIRAWEKVHGVRLPADPTHPVLRSVAQATDLTVEQVRDEQRKRRGTP